MHIVSFVVKGALRLTAFYIAMMVALSLVTILCFACPYEVVVGMAMMLILLAVLIWEASELPT